MLGGSADLTGSNLTNTKSTPALRFEADGSPRRDENGRTGRHINYGVREFGMAAVMNGVALHGGFIPYGGTFLTFSDYSRNAIRMAALMKQRVIHVFTHDSIGLGEDGPTHQSVEHAAALRLIPNLDVWRPCDTARDAGGLGCGGRPTRRPDGAAAVAPEPALRAQAGVRSGPARRRARRDRQGRLRARRAGRGRPQAQAPGGADRHRLGGAARAATRSSCWPGRSTADRGAGGVDALDHGVRPPGPRLQGIGAARGRAAHRGRDGRDRRLVEIRLRRGRRHRPLRRIGTRRRCCSSTSGSRRRTSWPRFGRRSRA